MLFSYLVDDLDTDHRGMLIDDRPISRFRLVEIATERLEADTSLEEQGVAERLAWEAEVRAIQAKADANLADARIISLVPPEDASP